MAESEDNPLNTRRSLLGRLKDWQDERSWQDFFDTYWRLIYTTARKDGLSDAEAQEVVQETVLSVAKKMKEFEYDPALGSFKGWLKLVTRRRIVDQYRKRRPQEVSAGDSDKSDTGTGALERVPDSATERTDSMWETDWQRNLMERALEVVKSQISPRQYQIFDLYVLRQLSAAEVATSLGISSAQVHLAKHRVQGLVKKEVRRLEKTLF